MSQAPESALVSRLLVVDDDLIQRRLIAKIAAQAGHEVAQACSVAEAEAILAQTCLEQRPFDCVTVDLGLTDGVGADLLHLTAEKCPGARVLIVTGETGHLLDDTLTIAREHEIEIAHIFIKPLDLVGLRDALKRERESLARRSAA
ncbi:hypothetical protein CCR94_15405 [Rhodoblastus sphagnicola]|uniref:Uncharacterized protein n=1 Tax=Rhodoblastus sphagnicola TaxID=333368 RepID=A0A2S6N435_9HYPH|nr:response regulator [Rhodoblastus sphagnicola]MBB4196550.1 DNA-binding NtrC family response regulator [Rhodoblastus sphagnicola]PPQ29383.1 hypothetical protein CCR94_15405 [Rhodoblastus sphagnicola]